MVGFRQITASTWLLGTGMWVGGAWLLVGTRWLLSHLGGKAFLIPLFIESSRTLVGAVLLVGLWGSQILTLLLAIPALWSERAVGARTTVAIYLTGGLASLALLHLFSFLGHRVPPGPSFHYIAIVWTTAICVGSLLAFAGLRRCSAGQQARIFLSVCLALALFVGAIPHGPGEAFASVFAARPLPALSLAAVAAVSFGALAYFIGGVASRVLGAGRLAAWSSALVARPLGYGAVAVALISTLALAEIMSTPTSGIHEMAIRARREATWQLRASPILFQHFVRDLETEDLLRMSREPNSAPAWIREVFEPSGLPRLVRDELRRRDAAVEAEGRARGRDVR